MLFYDKKLLFGSQGTAAELCDGKCEQHAAITLETD